MPRDGALGRVRDPDPDRDGQARSHRPGARSALRTSSPWRVGHIDGKKLGRIQGGAGKRVRDGLRSHYTPRRNDAAGVRRKTVGWEYVYVAIDDATRLAYVEVLGDENATTAVGFLRRAVAHYHAASRSSA